MKKAYIFLNGTLVNELRFDKMDFSQPGIIVLYKIVDNNYETAAVIPNTYLIITT